MTGHAAILLADLHAGSQYGLWHPDALLDEGGKHELNKFQDYLWQCWRHLCDVWLPSVCGERERIVILAGDLVDGINQRSAILSDDPTVQCDAAVMLLEPICKGVAVYAVSGTEFHAGKSAMWDNTVASRLGAIKDGTGRAARWRLFLTVDDVILDVAHHAGGSMVPQSRATPLTREYIGAGMASFEDEWPKPDWIIRAHTHRYRPLPERRSTIIFLPSMQASTPYVHKLTRMAPPDVGAFVLLTGDGRAEPQVKLYRWPVPVLEDVSSTTTTTTTTTATPGPASPSTSGWPSLSNLRRVLTGH